MSVPSAEAGSTPSGGGFVDQVKAAIGDDRLRLRLFDLVAMEVRRFCQVAAGDAFSITDRWDLAVFRDRIRRYEEEATNLVLVQGLLGHWSTDACSPCLMLAPTRLVASSVQSGNTGWLALRWYPALLLLYAGGIGAVASGNYPNLNRLFTTEVSSPAAGDHGPQPFIKAVLEGSADVADAFKALPNHERHHVPRSEYLFESLRQPLDKVLFLASDYERLFDRFEVLLTLEQAHQAGGTQDVAWAPPGRFAWKYRGRHDGDPFNHLLKEATRQGAAWPPLSAGLFGGSYERFAKVHEQYAGTIARTGWY